METITASGRASHTIDKASQINEHSSNDANQKKALKLLLLGSGTTETHKNRIEQSLKRTLTRRE